MSTARYLIGDVFDRLKEIPDGTVDLVMTSPPFLALRSYLPAGHPDKAKEIGSEATPAEFIDTLLELTAEWGRVLAPHGSICVELGDTYSGSGGAGGDYNADGLREGQAKFDGSNQRRGRIVDHDSGRRTPQDGWPLDKSLTGIPTLYAWSLAYGRNLLTGQDSPAGQWRIRNVVAWVRPNPPVGALCVDDQTEALTPDGWKRHDQLADGDLIAAYDPHTDTCRFTPAKFVRYHREGEPMVAIDKRSTSQRLTEDHRVWTRTRKSAPHVRLAQDLTNDCDTLLCAPFDDVAGPSPVTTERAALLGWYIAEGSPHHRQARIVQSQTANPHKVERIRHLLDTDGGDYHETSYQHGGGSTIVTFHVKGELAEWLNLHHKRLPMQYVTTWPEAQAQALYDALVDGDGHRRKNADGVLFHQQDERVMDAMQVLALRLGYRATKTYQPTMRLWQLTMSKDTPTRSVRWTRVRKWDGEGIRREIYTGTVWCPMVETSFWLARRNGKTFITGNSDKFRPATSYLTIATQARNRYFDLDAVRTPHAYLESQVQNGKRATDTGGNRSDDGGTFYNIGNPAGAPPLDWWNIPTQPYKGAHYAAYPPALCTRPILAMTPQRVCTTCGEPSRRIVEVDRTYRREAKLPPSGPNLSRNDGGAGPFNHDETRTTTGWSDCGCPGDDRWRPGHVLDPFAGSGTTLAVATGHGRDATGIDLDERNAHLALERIGMFLTVDTGPEAEAS